MAGKITNLRGRGRFGDIVPARDARLSKKDALALHKVASALLADGNYSLEAMVDAARPKSSPIHHLLDWNVTRAADWAWRTQMRNLMGKVEIIVHTSGGEERVKWLHVVTEDGTKKRSVAIDVATVDEAREIASQCFTDAVYIYERYHTMARVYPKEMRPFSAFLAAAEKLRKVRNIKQLA